MKEVFNYTQDDLTTEEVLILDCYNEIYVWVGLHSSVSSKQQALTLGKVIAALASNHKGFFFFLMIMTTATWAWEFSFQLILYMCVYVYVYMYLIVLNYNLTVSTTIAPCIFAALQSRYQFLTSFLFFL